MSTQENVLGVWRSQVFQEGTSNGEQLDLVFAINMTDSLFDEIGRLRKLVTGNPGVRAITTDGVPLCVDRWFETSQDPRLDDDDIANLYSVDGVDFVVSAMGASIAWTYGQSANRHVSVDMYTDDFCLTTLAKCEGVDLDALLMSYMRRVPLSLDELTFALHDSAIEGAVDRLSALLGAAEKLSEPVSWTDIRERYVSTFGSTCLPVIDAVARELELDQVSAKTETGNRPGPRL